MPIGVPLIICGSIALVGSGYAFKKLVYDQHLSHYIEAFIANHLPSSSNPILAAPVPSSSNNDSVEGRTSAWSKGVDRLRRRGGGRREEEDGEPLISLHDRPHHGVEQSSHPRPRALSPDFRYGNLLHDQEDERKEEGRGSVDLNNFNNESFSEIQPHRTHDDEIKSTIFNLPQLTQSSDQPARADPFSDPSHLHPPNQDAGPSGTFSFLSLSQVSSPEGTAAMLDSMTFSHFGSTTDNVREGGRDDVMSLPDTGYTSEAFSNISSPRSGFRSPLSDDNRLRETRGNGGLGLAVEDLGLSFVPLRRQDSVRSFSESEVGSDWERVSEARSTQ